MTWLECQHGGEIKRVLMIANPISIGRASTCDFAFSDDREVSRMHAIVEKRNHHWYLVDQKSTNGSYVNSQRVTVPFPIKEGDLIEIGCQRLHVREGLSFVVQERPTTPVEEPTDPSESTPPTDAETRPTEVPPAPISTVVVPAAPPLPEGPLYAGYPHHYIILKVPYDATKEEIERAYRILKAVFREAPCEDATLLARLEDELDASYAILGDPIKRAEYDVTVLLQYRG